MTFNKQFSQVIFLCGHSPHRLKQGQKTWITPSMVRAYENFHRQGFAYSVECWRGEELVGGLYGVCLNHYLSGESMFFIPDKGENASKISLIALMIWAHTQNITVLDTQMVTDVTKSLGAKEIPRKDFLNLHHLAMENKTTISFPTGFFPIHL